MTDRMTMTDADQGFAAFELGAWASDVEHLAGRVGRIGLAAADRRDLLHTRAALDALRVPAAGAVASSYRAGACL